MSDFEARRRRISLLPNLLTTCNIISGFYCLISAYHGRFEHAAYAILAAGVFDILDGRVARAIGSESRFGVEYDSLADVLSFGLAPAFLMYSWSLESFGRVGWVAAVLYLICVALRLARFNVQKEDDARPVTTFVGLPSPAGALTICGLVLFELNYGLFEPVRSVLALVMVFSLSFLLVSTIPYAKGGSAEPHPFRNLVSGVLILIALIADPPLVLFVLSLVYVASGILKWAWARRRTHAGISVHLGL